MRSTMYITPKIYPWLIEIYLTQKIYPWILEIGSEMYLIPKLPMVLRNRVENVPDFYVMTVVRVIKNKLCQSNGRSNNHLTQGGTAMVHSHSRSEHPSKNLHNTLHVRSRWCGIHTLSRASSIRVMCS